jgi:hypothetical protein
MKAQFVQMKSEINSEIISTIVFCIVSKQNKFDILEEKSKGIESDSSIVDKI